MMFPSASSRRSFISHSVAFGLAMAALFSGLTSPAMAAPPENARAKHVFIISFDGGKPAVMQKSKMPTLFSMVKEGASDWNAQTIFPSITLVSHTSMLTGVSPAKHKIMWNEWEPEKGALTVPTVFAVPEQKESRPLYLPVSENFST